MRIDLSKSTLRTALRAIQELDSFELDKISSNKQAKWFGIMSDLNDFANDVMVELEFLDEDFDL